jgi:hypothetical protein
MDEAAVKALIDNAVGGLQAEATRLKEANESLQKKQTESELVIADQARKLVAVAAEKVAVAEQAVKVFCKYGTDGDGRGNSWPSRHPNEPERDDPHHFDVSTDPGYILCAGKYRLFKHEYRTLACVGSYLADFGRDIKVIFDELRAGGTGDEALDKQSKRQADELENTLDGARDLLACRFGFIGEFIKPDQDQEKITALWKRLYPREGVPPPASSLDAWSLEFDKLRQTQVTKQLAVASAKSDVKFGDEPAARGGVVPKPRFGNLNKK